MDDNTIKAGDKIWSTLTGNAVAVPSTKGETDKVEVTLFGKRVEFADIPESKGEWFLKPLPESPTPPSAPAPQ